MKKILGILAVMLMFVSCEDKLDIKPLGKTTLDSVDDLETLLNQWFTAGRNMTWSDMECVANTSLPIYKSVSDVLSNRTTLEYAQFTYDESINRASLTATDDRYNELYSHIMYMNVVISKMPDASGGTAQRKAQYVSEARVMRAWLHFLLVNIHAKQYDEATADHLGGIAYVDNTNAQEQKTKLSVAKVYEKMLADCSDDVLENLEVRPKGEVCRVGKAFGYAVRARVLFQMKRYEEALKYANLALSVNNTIEDRSSILTSGEWVLSEDAENNYIFIGTGKAWSTAARICLTRETAALVEPGYYNLEEYAWNNDGLSASMAEEDFELSGSLAAGNYSAQVNTLGLRSENMFYVAAECMIRQGNYKQGLNMVDMVRKNRIDAAIYQPFADRADAGMTEAQAMELLQAAKKIEMLATYENFFDCKRWNSEPAYARTLTRTCDQGTYSISPESPLWVMPFPQQATNLNKSLTQNY